MKPVYMVWHAAYDQDKYGVGQIYAKEEESEKPWA